MNDPLTTQFPIGSFQTSISWSKKDVVILGEIKEKYTLVRQILFLVGLCHTTIAVQ